MAGTETLTLFLISGNTELERTCGKCENRWKTIPKFPAYTVISIFVEGKNCGDRETAAAR